MIPIVTFPCKTCGTMHERTPYIQSILRDRPHHECDNCGAIHVLYEHGYDLLKPGEDLTPWFPNDVEHAPVRDGYYALLLMSGQKAKTKWWWNSKQGRFFFDPNSPASLGLDCIKGWRGLNNPITSYSEGP